MGLLRFEPLEERILLDGAIAHDVSNAPTSAPPPAADHNSPHPNLVVIQDSLRDAETIKHALHDDVVILSYNPKNEDLASLGAKISQALGDNKANSITFISEGAQGQFNLLNNKDVSKDTLQETSMHNFWDDVASHILPVGSINILGSEVAKGDAGAEFIRALDSIVNAKPDSQIKIFASVNRTGSLGLQGDWVTEYPHTGPPAQDLASTLFDSDAIGKWDGLLSKPAQTQNHILVVPNNISDLSIIQDSVRNGVSIVTYNPETSTLESLYANITNALHGQKADSIAFMTAGTDGRFNLLNGTEVNSQTLDSVHMQQFWVAIASTLKPDGAVDILGCNVAATEAGQQFLHELDSILDSSGHNINVNASVDITGSESNNGNWNLEFTTAPNAQTNYLDEVYFVSNIDNWDHSLDNIPLASVIITPFNANNGSLYVSRAGSIDTVRVVLSQAPTANVSITFFIDNPTQGRFADNGLSTYTVTFTPLNWNITQYVRVQGLNNVANVSDVTFNVISQAAVSSDALYNGVDGVEVPFININSTGPVQEPFVPRYFGRGNLNVTMGANTVITTNPAPPSTSYNFSTGNNVYVDIDGDASTFNSSSSNISLPVGANVQFAYLTWFGQRPGASFDQILFKAPGSVTYTTLTAMVVDPLNTTTVYTAGRDVTSLVKAAGAGTYTIANLQTTQGFGTFGGWSLFVSYTDPGVADQRVVIFNTGLDDNSVAGPTNVVNNFTVRGPVTATLLYAATHGEPTFTTDNFQINGLNVTDATHLLNNFNTGSISIFGSNLVSRNPNYINNLGSDFALINVSSLLSAGQTSATFTSTVTPGFDYTEPFFTGLYVTSQAQADVTINKNVYNVTAPGQDIVPGDTLEYHVYVGNTGVDTANNVYITDLIPTNTTYVPGSLSVNSIAQTDAVGDDLAEISAGLLTFRLGTGANGLTGGTFAVNDSGYITFRVTVNNVATGTILTNNGVSHWTNAFLGTTQTNTSLPTINYVRIPQLSINSPSQAEGNSGNTPLNFTVTVSNSVLPHVPLNRNISFNYNTSNGTATLANNDYVLASGTISGNASAGSFIIPVSIVGDTNYENNETFTVTLSSAVSSNITTPTGTGTIVNDDVNNAPVLNNAANLTLTTIVEDYYSNAGSTVGGILSSDISVPNPITDPDSIGGAGIAITAIDTTHGSWQYYVGSTNTWIVMPAVSFTNALLLDSADHIRFVPNADYNGSSTFTFRAWDKTNGLSAGTTANLTGFTGGSGAYSTASDTTTITITPVNDQPTLDNSTNPALTTIYANVTNPAGNTVANILASGPVAITDPDLTDILGIAVTGINNTNGTWQYSINGGGAWTPFGGGTSATAAVVLLPTDLVRFVPNAGFTGTVTNGLQFKAWDQSDGAVHGSVVNTTLPYDGFGPELQVNNLATTGSQASADILHFGTNQNLVLWSNYNDLTIRARMVNDSGVFTGNEFILVSGLLVSAPDQWDAAVLDTGNFAIAWTGADTGTTTGIFSRTFQFNGTPISGIIQDNLIAAGNQHHPGLGAISGGQYVVAWKDGNNPANIFAQRLTEAGGFVASTFQVNTTAAQNFASADVTGLPGGGWVVTWVDQNAPVNVYARQYNSAGVALGNNFLVATSTGTVWTSASFAAPNGNYYVDYVASDGNLTGLFLQQYSALGVAIGAPVRINTATAGSQLSAFYSNNHLDFDEGFGYMAAFYGPDANGFGIYAKHYDSFGAVIRDEIPVNFTTNGDQAEPTVQSLGNGKFLFAYQSFNIDGSAEAVVIRVYDSLAPESPYSAAIEGASITVLPVNVSVSDVSQVEGNTGTTTFVFTLTANVAAPNTINVTFSTANGTALVSDNDYNASSGTAQILAGQTTGTITITVIGDTKFEANETFLVNLIGITAGNVITDNQGQGTIVNDDSVPVLSISNEDGATTPSDSSVIEGNSLTTPLVFRAVLSNPTDQTISFQINTQNGTALVSDSDYVSIVGNTVTILPNNSDATFTVLVNGDTKYEANETLAVLLSSISNATFTGGGPTLTATGTIINDDNLPVVSISNEDGGLTPSDSSVIEGNAGTTPLVFRALLSNLSDQSVSFQINTQNGTALTSDSDYVSIVGNTVTILPLATDITFNVLVNGDNKYELNETLSVILSAINGGTFFGGNSTLEATGTIINDDAIPSASFDAGSLSVTQNEGNTGLTPYNFTVNLSNPSYQDITVTYTTQDGSALGADNDYIPATSGQLVILAGQTTGTLTVYARGDVKFEPDENFLVNLIAVANGNLGSSNLQATAGVINDDAPPTFSIENTNGSRPGDASVREGNTGQTPLVITVTLSNPSYEDIVLNVNTSDGTATVADNDYTPHNNTITIAAGSLSASVNLSVIGDSAIESDESFALTANQISGTTSNTSANGTAAILNDDFDIVAAPPPPPAPTPFVIPPPALSPIDMPRTSFLVSLGIDQINLPNYEGATRFNELPDIVVTNFAYDLNQPEHQRGWFSIYLTTRPKAAVTINLEGHNLPDGAISPKSVTFTPDNWNHPQIVNVNDAANNAKVVTEPAQSSDQEYDKIDPNDVDVWDNSLSSQDPKDTTIVDAKTTKQVEKPLTSINKNYNNKSNIKK